MCWIGVLWPQATWSRVSPKTAAIRSRSSGLGVHRPSPLAATRCPCTPDRAERWRGTGVEYRRRADGTVAAVCLGIAGVGPCEGDALRDLERRLRVPPPGWPPAFVA